MKRLDWLVLVFILSITRSAAAGTTKIGPPWAAVTINRAIANAHDGDVLLLTGSGIATWTEVVSIPANKGISLLVEKGTNGDWNDTRDARAGTKFPIVITSNQSNAIRIITGPNHSVTRISGFKFRGANSDAVVFVSGQGKGKAPESLGAYRIDNNYFDHIDSEAVIAVHGSTGELTGLVDNNTFDNPHWDNYTIRIRENWKGGTVACYGYDSWARAFSFGNNRFHFIEDNLFINTTEYQRHSISSDGAGGRYVSRFNTFISTLPAHTITPHGTAMASTFIDAHGDGTRGLGTGARGGEIYNNKFFGDSRAVYVNIGLRGGQWLVYDNVFTTLGASKSPIRLTEVRASSTDCWQIQYPSYCWPRIPQCANADARILLHPLPGQIQESYFWNNTRSGIDYAPWVNSTADIRAYIQAGRDYWVAADLADAQSSGLSPNYRPYAYPHPLRNKPASIASKD